MNVAFLHVRGSIDDAIWANISAKLGNIGQVRLGKAALQQGSQGLQHTLQRCVLAELSCVLDRIALIKPDVRQHTLFHMQLSNTAAPTNPAAHI